MRAAGAEIGQPQHRRDVAGGGALRPLQRLEPGAELAVVGALEQAAGDREGDLVRGQVAVAGEQQRPGLVVLAFDHRPPRQVVEQLLGLALDQAALLLDHDHRSSPPTARSSVTGSSGQAMPTL